MATAQARQLTQNPALLDRTERACLVMESEIDLAFSLLRLAEAETKGGDHAHARNLILRAGVTHKMALNYLDALAVGQEKQEFLFGVRKLFEAIRAVERLGRAQTDQESG